MNAPLLVEDAGSALIPYHVSLHENGEQHVLSVFMDISFRLTMGGYYCLGVGCIISRH